MLCWMETTYKPYWLIQDWKEPFDHLILDKTFVSGNPEADRSHEDDLNVTVTRLQDVRKSAAVFGPGP